MEPIIKSFSRVVRGIDDVRDVLALYKRVEKASLSKELTLTLTPKEKRSIIDIPEPDDQLANIAAACPPKKYETGNLSDEPPYSKNYLLRSVFTSTIEQS